jgi:hypothetical protein
MRFAMDDEEDFPTQDPLVKWRDEAKDLERQRRLAKRALRRQEQQTITAAVDVEARLSTKLVEQKDFLIEVCGQALGQVSEQLRDELLNKLAMLEQLQDRYARKLAAVEDVGDALNKFTQDLQKEFFAKVDELVRAMAGERAAHQRHLQQADEQFQALSKLYVREQALTNSKMAMLERQVDQLIATLSTNLQNAALRSDLFDGLAQLRSDLAQLQRKYHS